MAPAGGGKRKRGDRNFSHDSRDDNTRPSPHRPGNLSLAQQNSQQQSFSRDQYEPRGGGRGRGGRGGRRGGFQRSPINSPNGNAPQILASTARPASPPPPVQVQTLATAKTADQLSPLAATTAATQTTESKTSLTPLLYHYDYVTDRQIEKWAESGRDAVIAVGKQACQSEDFNILSLLYQDLMRSSIDARIPAVEAGLVIKDILEGHMAGGSADSSTFKPDELFLDTLSICAEAWNVSSVFKPLVFATGISRQLMRLVLDSSLLESLGMIRSTFVRVGIRQQTNLLYRQSNYNLLREETEGYSKLITELFTTSSGESLSSEIVEETFEKVKGMIGAFDLDVGRVLDVTLDVFAAVLVKQYRFFVKYLRASSWWPQDKSSEIRAEHGLGTLPSWALPGAAGRPRDDEEMEALAAARETRDHKFWQRAKEIGLKAFFEIGNRRPQQAELEAALTDSTVTNSTEAELDREWIEVTGTLPPVGNKIAAQILGFKLKFYSSQARDPTDALPMNLIYLAALLIKVGFISLRDLYPHLWPLDDSMEGVRESKAKENAEKERLSRPGASAPNALLTAGALTDDTIDPRQQREAARKRELEAARLNTVKTDVPGDAPAASADGEKDELPEPIEQKVQLLKSLLCIGAIPESLYMLGRFPWLLDAFTELPEHLHRIFHHCLSKVYDPLRPLKDQSDLREQPKLLDMDQSGAVKGQLKFIDAPPRKTMRWAQIDKDDTTEAIDYKFYWDEWADSIPVCQNVDDVFLLCSTLLNYSGIKIGQDSSLLVKLCRIGSYSLEADRSETNLARWIDLSKRLLVPAVSLTKSNPGVVNEVFELIKVFPLATRYSIYAEWSMGQTSRLPDIKASFDRAKLETRDILKRISKSNIKPMARALAKIAYACPGAVFQVGVAHIESYENFAETFTECARYFTYLAYDVFNWALISALSGSGKTRVQADGMLTSRWLQSLAMFVGKVFKRYSVMSPLPMLQYVSDQLRHGNAIDLIVLEEIVSSMAGIVSDTNFNERQNACMAGGPVLQSQVMLQLLDRRHESKTTAKRLIRCLAEPKLAGQILVSVAQERQRCVFTVLDKDAPAKLLGNLFDEVHRVLTQYIDFLRTNLSISDFDALVPDVVNLIQDFGIETGTAFWISRPSIAAAMSDYDSKNPTIVPEKKKSPTKELSQSDTAKGDSHISEQEQGPNAGSNVVDAQPKNSVQGQQTPPAVTVNGKAEPERLDLEMKESHEGETAPDQPAPKNGTGSPQPKWHPVLEPIIHTVRSSLPAETWENLTPSFYVTFWSLSLSDVLVPSQYYEEEQRQCQKKILAVSSDRSDISIAGTQRKEREKKALSDVTDRLRAEHRDRVNAFSKQRNRLHLEKLHWFADLWGKWDASNTALIEQCFFPRIRMSSLDALFSFRMFKFLHSSGTTNFRTLGFLDHLFREKRLTSMLYLCSAKEAENLGRFLFEILRDLSRWHANKVLFEKEAYGNTKYKLKGFCTKISPDDSNDVYMGYEDFRRILLKWHINLNKALKTCFTSGEYMHIRNAINVLLAIVDYFPIVNWMGRAQAECTAELMRPEEEREDLRLAASSLNGNIRNREKKWVLPQAFSLTEPGTNGASLARPGSAKPSTPQREGDGIRQLNPKAPDFQPAPQASANGISKQKRTGDPEAEDGEIEDAKMTDVMSTGPAPEPQAMPQPGAAKAPAASAANPNIPPKPSQSPQTQPNLPVVDQLPPKPALSSQPIAQPRLPQQPEIPTSSNIEAQISIPPRPEGDKSLSTSLVNGRVQHSLPNRPELQSSKPASPWMTGRQGERNPRDFTREPRTQDPLNDNPRDRTSDRHVHGQYPRNQERLQDIANAGSRERSDQLPHDGRMGQGRGNQEDRRIGNFSQDARSSLREDRSERYQRDREYPEPRPLRAGYAPPPSARDTAMPPPRSSIPQHPDRAALIQGGRGAERLPSTGQQPDRRPEPSRYDDLSTSGRTSRGQSPTRSDDRRPLRHESRRDFRHGDRPPVEDRRSYSDSTYPHGPRYDEGHPPAGPRIDRPGMINHSGASEDSVKPSSSSAPSVDSNHGRLIQDPHSSGRQSEQYGRLSSANEVPSGPRITNGSHSQSRNTRNMGAPQPQVSSRQQQSTIHEPPPPSPTMDRQAPTGPASNRSHSRNATTFPRVDGNSSAPPTPNIESSDTAGIHPDRLKAFQELDGASASQNPNSGASQSSMGRPPPRQQQPPPVSVPRGPSNQQMPPSPVGPSPTNRGPPTGPGRSDKRFAGLQGVLQQANTPNGADRGGQGASIRGRGGRPSNVNLPSPAASGPPTPLVQTPDDYPIRKDLFAGRSGGSATSYQGDEDLGYNRNGRRNSARDSSNEVMRDGSRDFTRDAGADLSRNGGREAPRDGSRSYPREAHREDERYPSRQHGSHSNSRDQGHLASHNEYDIRHPPPLSRRDDGMRDLRSRTNGPLHSNDLTRGDPLRRPPRGDGDLPPMRDRRGPDQREQGDWGRGERDQRDQRDRRDVSGGSTGRERKRGRVIEEETGTDVGSAEKRARRGP